MITYIIWTLIHGLATDIGNPYSVDRTTANGDNDAIYDVINWTERPLPTFITLTILLLVAGPLFFSIYFGLSVWIPRRYLPEEKEEEVLGSDGDDLVDNL